MITLKISDSITIGNNKLAIITGPCVIESRDMVLTIAEKIKEISEELSIPIIFKASFDKANRSSIKSYRGPGIDDGLKILDEVKNQFNLSVTTDIHEPSQAIKIAEVCDILQIPAFLCRQTALLIAAANTGKTINVKKGQFMAPWDMDNVINKLLECNNPKIMLTERGTTFGYGRLVNDMRSIPLMRKFGYPVVFDATHSVQLPGAGGDKTEGERHMVPTLAKAAIACGIDVLFLETHPDPDNAKSDGPNMIELHRLRNLLADCLKIHKVIRKCHEG